MFVLKHCKKNGGLLTKIRSYYSVLVGLLRKQIRFKQSNTMVTFFPIFSLAFKELKKIRIFVATILATRTHTSKQLAFRTIHPSKTFTSIECRMYVTKHVLNSHKHNENIFHFFFFFISISIPFFLSSLSQFLFISLSFMCNAPFEEAFSKYICELFNVCVYVHVQVSMCALSASNRTHSLPKHTHRKRNV